MDKIKMTEAEWNVEGERLFGKDRLLWKFVCPICGHVAAVQDWKAAGAPIGAVAFSCIGRYQKKARKAFGEKGPGPCDYAGGGLFPFNPVVIEGQKENRFDFARGATP
jgi:hypothetical protein